MKKSKQISSLLMIFAITVQLMACGINPPASTATLTMAPSITLTSMPSKTEMPSSSSSTIVPSPSPSIIPSMTPIIAFSSTPNFCSSAQGQGKIMVMSPSLFTALEPGGPPVFDRILVKQNPAWADFRQYHDGEIRSAGVIFHEVAFGPPIPELGAGVNPAVLLVTYGVDREWELPADGDLVSEVDYIRAVLHQRENYWILGTVDRSQYPMIADAATYALYYYFGGDLSQLENWCHIYLQVFGESPLK